MARKTRFSKMQQAMTKMIMDYPFFSGMALSLKFQEATWLKTAAVDGVNLFYNPDFIDSLEKGEVLFVIAHEVLHCVLGHHARRKGRDMSGWNIACDHAVNLLLEKQVSTHGMKKPADLHCDPQFEGMSAEAIFNKIPDPPDTGGAGGASPDGRGFSDPNGCGGVMDLPGKDDQPAKQQDLDQSAAKWVDKAVSAAHVAKSAGKLPAGMDRFIRDLTKPVVNWRALLRDWVERTARNDYSFARRNRRFASSAFFMPSLISNELGDIAFVIDTSGSVSTPELTRAASELSEILEEFDATVHVFYVDARCYEPETFTREDLPLKFSPKGGGGTDFRPAFDYIDEHGIGIAGLIYFTDMYCSSFPEQPDFPVLWLDTANSQNEPPFGELVKVEIEP